MRPDPPSFQSFSFQPIPMPKFQLKCFCSYIADCQIPKACFKFVEEHGGEILEKNLSRNFLVHLVNLFDFSLIRPEVVQRAYAMLENLRESMGLAL